MHRRLHCNYYAYDCTDVDATEEGMSPAFSALAGGAIALAGLVAIAQDHAVAAPNHAAHPTVVTKEVHDRYSFAPQRESVRRGTTVTWTNKTDAEHNVTFDSGHAGKWNKDFKEHQSIHFHFTKPGTYRYHCEYHPYMKGVIVVKP